MGITILCLFHNIKLFVITAGSSNDLSLSSWGLPEPVLKQYHSRGIKEMFPWQAECLQMGNVLGKLILAKEKNK